MVRAGQEAEGKYTVLLHVERVHEKIIALSGKLGCGLSFSRDFWGVGSRQGPTFALTLKLPEKAGPDLVTLKMSKPLLVCPTPPSPGVGQCQLGEMVAGLQTVPPAT